MGSGGGAPVTHLLLCFSRSFFFLVPLLAGAVMAPIRRFSAVEKGKTPLNKPELLLPKKGRSHRREMVVRPVVSRPWYERPPPRHSLRLYAQAEGSGGRGAECHSPSLAFSCPCMIIMHHV